MLRLDSQEAQHLAKSILLEESGTPLISRAVIWFSVFMIVAFTTWAAVAPISEVAIADGQVVPTGQVQEVQHLEGGRIKAVFVEDGQMVEQGQVLMHLDSLVSESELHQALARAISLQLHRERLSAFMDDRTPDFAKIARPDSPEVAEQILIFSHVRTSKAAARDVLLRQIAQHKAELAELRALEKTLRDRAAYFKEEMGISRKLHKEGLISRSELLALEGDYSKITGEVDAIPSQRSRIRNKIAESESRLSQVDSEYKENALIELERIVNDLNQVQEVIRRHQRLVDLAEIRSPVAGIVHGLTTHTIGGVVSAGQTIVKVVPSDRELVAEVRISPADVGHIKVGQPVTLKFLSYDFARYGGIDGALAQISATTFPAADGQPYYKGVVTFEGTQLHGRKGSFPILPGMTLTGDIKTGDKTVLEYILRPIYASSQQALQER